MSKVTKKNKIKERFINYLKNNTSDCELVSEWNRQSKNCYIYDIEEFSNITKDKKTLEVLAKVGSNFNLNHKYFFIDNIGKYQSFNRFSDSSLPIDWDIFVSNLIKRCNQQIYVKFLEMNI